jgi:hexosaminidase
MSQNSRGFAAHHAWARQVLPVFLLVIAMLLALVPQGPAAVAADEDYGTNVALASKGGIATSSGQEVPDRLGPELAIDGISDSDVSRWSGEYADDSWFQVELPEPTDLHEVRIRWSNSCPVQYKLQVSDDGQNWVDATPVLRPQTCAAWEVQDLRHVEGEHTFVRMQGIERRVTQGFPYGYSINELEVWDGPQPPPEPVLALSPLPASLVKTDEEPFVLRPDARIVATGPARPAAEELAEVLRPSTGYDVPIVAAGPLPGDVTIIVDQDHVIPGFEDNDEAYALDVDVDGVTLTSATGTGAFYGVQTLRQLLPTFVEADHRVTVPWTAPAVDIEDGPRFGYRGLMLDLVRSYISPEQVKEFIDSMSYVKMNVLHLHLADDQGWRIEITNDGRAEGDDIDYTRLTNISGQTAIEAGGPQNIPGTPGFLTQEQYTEIVEYAAEHEILVIPEIDGPAHSAAMLHAIPQLNTANSVPQPPPGEDTIPADSSYLVGHTSLDTRADVTYTFLEHVVDQLAELTPGPYIHVGGDEGHSTSHEDYVHFMDEVTQIVRDAGKRPMGWNEIAAAVLQPGDVVHYYNHDPAQTIAAANENGADVVVSWHPNTYLDYGYGHGDFDTYYNWEVMARFPGLSESSVLGVEAPLWTPNTRSDDETEYQVYPRLISTAEVGWTPGPQRDVGEFARRLAQIGGRLTLQDVNFYPSPRADWLVEVAGIDQKVTRDGATGERLVGVALAPGTQIGDLEISVDWGDGSLPTSGDVTVTHEPDIVHGVGAYLIKSEHTFARPGTYEGRVTVEHRNGTESAPIAVTVLSEPLSVTDCKDGGWADYGFSNQGRCVSFVQADENAGKRIP